MIDAYDWSGGREAMLRFGPASRGPVVVVAMPLLEEWNRTRAFTVALLRALGERGITSVLPDLPGHGESLKAAADITISQMAEAIESVTHTIRSGGRPTVGMGIRGGTLLDGRAPHAGRWHFAPVTGADLLGELHRTWLAGDGRSAGDGPLAVMTQTAGPLVVAGTPLSADLLRSLSDARPFDQPDVARRVVRLRTDPRAADEHIEGIPIWRRAEPGNDPALVQLLADDLAAWVATCDV